MDDAIHRHRLLDALQLGGAESRELEIASCQALGRHAHDHGVRVCDSLEPGRDVHRVPEGKRLGLPFGSSGADDRDAGVDTDSSCKLVLGADESLGSETLHRANDLEARSDCVHGVVASRVWIAEVGEHTVALELCDMPVEALDHLRAGGVVRGDQFPEVLGVEPVPERRRADKVAEQNSEMPALGAALRLSPFSGGCDWPQRLVS